MFKRSRFLHFIGAARGTRIEVLGPLQLNREDAVAIGSTAEGLTINPMNMEIHCPGTRDGDNAAFGTEHPGVFDAPLKSKLGLWYVSKSRW